MSSLHAVAAWRWVVLSVYALYTDFGNLCFEHCAWFHPVQWVSTSCCRLLEVQLLAGRVFLHGIFVHCF